MREALLACGEGDPVIVHDAARPLADPELFERALLELAGSGADAVMILPVSYWKLSDREIAHHGITHFHVVKTMHERKALMYEHADAFIALPGGYGTLDEFIEIVTWAQLKLHQKPCILININGYYDGFLAFLDHYHVAGLPQA